MDKLPAWVIEGILLGYWNVSNPPTEEEIELIKRYLEGDNV